MFASQTMRARQALDRLVHPVRLEEFRASPEQVKGALNGRGGTVADAFFAQTDRGVHKWGHYLPAYERQFGQYVGQPVRFLEIGVFYGGSLEMWRRYLGPQATIFGIDVDPRSRVADSQDHPVRVGSQADAAFLRSVVDEMGGIDVVLDDGSHKADDQRVSFETLFPLLADGGLYSVEDLHTSYWRRHYRGGYRRRGTFIEVAKDLVDGMHAWYYKRPAPRLGRIAKTEIESVCFYDSMVFIAKRHHGQPIVTRVGKPSW